MSEDWEQELERVRSSVSSLKYEWEEERGSLQSDHSYLDSRVDRIKDEVDVLDSGHTELVDRIAEAEAHIAAVARQVQWLERRARAGAGEEPVVLDAVDDRARALCAAVREMYEQRDALLTVDQRARLRKTVAAHEQRVQGLAQARMDMVAASRTLARVPLESSEHSSAAMAFRIARNTIDAAHGSNQDQLAGRARNAAAALAEDQDTSAAVQPALLAGEKARGELETRVRTRIAEEVAKAALLPVWFTTVFGPLPDRKDPQEWLGDATDAVLYRMVYGVRDSVLLLGEQPDPDEDSAQCHQWTKLQRSVAQWSS
ncbi:hypothetical protein [Streptacidiphilus carbonis]|uniref:hypothetical protein n=1 Tax=Streptacidiphilus carbonis TaxID=105422 RepID=UPI0005AA1457|nr:hypothetical protein [Streptacidiphilus carbonis]